MSRTSASLEQTAEAKAAAMEVLLNNVRGPCQRLPRTAAWGYPEPYTRDMMISALGFLSSGDSVLRDALRRVLLSLARTQTPHGHIASLAHDPKDLGASDTTPLFLFGLGLYRKVTGDKRFLRNAAMKALRWMEYQGADDMVMVDQQPTTDWRDEQWVLGYGLYVNTIVYACLRLHGQHRKADLLRCLIDHPDLRGSKRQRYVHEGFVIPGKPYYALWSFKVYHSRRFDLLGNSLAILTGIAPQARAQRIINWTETQCRRLRRRGELAVDLPPCLIPYIQPEDQDWRPRYQRYNRPGNYHNGGVWPFVCGFYIAALVAAGRSRLAAQKLAILTELVRPAKKAKVSYGFNEWIKAQTGRPRGHDWQTWSAAMYLYAAECVEQGRTPFFDEIRRLGRSSQKPDE
ncbi:MAG TPA: glycoside hydrolase 100 family protein [Phycisphaerae bacterium]|nr:glycoside hydrolase 100 family protein [Phycisphaerae bacterium]HRR84282.1 glycoside hydrolase 100 family protein [Phycisphaerae bacterium]